MTDRSAPTADADACVRLYERERPRLVAYARTLTGDPWRAEDLAAEAHFRIWRRLRAGEVIGNVPACLTTTVRSLAKAVQGAAAREVPGGLDRDHGWAADHGWAGEGGWAGGPSWSTEPPVCVAQTDVLAGVLEQLPQRWVKALWLAEAEAQPLEEIGRWIGTGRSATAALLHRAREVMRESFLRAQPGAPANPVCRTYWDRMPERTPGSAAAPRPDGSARHHQRCPDCRGRGALLAHADERLPALVGPALLLLRSESTGQPGDFLTPLAAAVAAAGPGGMAGGVRHSMRLLRRGHIAQAGPVAAVAAGVGVLALAGAVAATGLALVGGGGTAVSAEPGQRAVAVAPPDTGGDPWAGTWPGTMSGTPSAVASATRPATGPASTVLTRPPLAIAAPGTPTLGEWRSPSALPPVILSGGQIPGPVDPTRATTAAPTPWATSTASASTTGPTARPTAPRPKPTPTPTRTPSHTPTPTPTRTPSPTPTPTPSPTEQSPTPSPTQPTPTASPTATPAPTPTPTGTAPAPAETAPAADPAP